MKKYLFLAAALFLGACAGPSSNFVEAPMPVFRPLNDLNTNSVQASVKVAFAPIIIEQNNDYSDYFQNSVLKLRIDKATQLLKDGLEKQMKNILISKGYEIDNTNAKYSLKSLVNVNVLEQNLQKDSQFLKGEFVTSNLILSFSAKLDFIELNSKNTTNITSNTRLDPININYAINSGEGVSGFQTTISAVPTQLNKDLSRPAYEIDKSFLTFYKSTLNALNTNLKSAVNINSSDFNAPLKQSQENQPSFNEFNEFKESSFENEIKNESFNEPNLEQNFERNLEQNSPKNDDGFIIFD